MTDESPGSVEVDYYSDVLCVWAYAGHRRIEELVQTFGDRIRIVPHYCSVFSDAWTKIETKWGPRNSFEAFGDHVQEVGAKFDHITLHGGLWRDVRPQSSAGAHLFLKALEIAERDGLGAAWSSMPFQNRKTTQADWALRHAFFAQGQDLSDWRVHHETAQSLGMDYDAHRRCRHPVTRRRSPGPRSRQGAFQGDRGSPTFVMNGGRQKLFGNVGYRLLEANIQELLRTGTPDDASWC